jgi:hypothetical protein
MPDRAKLKIGDRIQLLRVPDVDLEQRERELREGREDAGWTANTIERIIRIDPIVTINEIDEMGMPWFDYELPDADGQIEYHSIAIMENKSWRLVKKEGKKRRKKKRS